MGSCSDVQSAVTLWGLLPTELSEILGIPLGKKYEQRRQLRVMEPHLEEARGGGMEALASIPCLPRLFHLTPVQQAGKRALMGQQRQEPAESRPLPTCTHMMWTMTPMPDTASRSTAFSMAWEMVSNRCSGSCRQSRTLSDSDLVWLLCFLFSGLKVPGSGFCNACSEGYSLGEGSLSAPSLEAASSVTLGK